MKTPTQEMEASVLAFSSLCEYVLTVYNTATDINGDGDDMELVWSETVTSPSIHDVHLTGN